MCEPTIKMEVGSAGPYRRSLHMLTLSRICEVMRKGRREAEVRCIT
jgi:hypothetical protein